MERKYEEVATTPEDIATVDRKKHFWHVNKGMLPIKMHFFLLIGGLGAILPYETALAITRLGLTPGNIAAAYITQQILFILLNPGIGYLVDYFNRLKATIIALSIIQLVVFLLMIIIPRVDLQSSPQAYNTSVKEKYSCHLCSLYKDFQSISAFQSFDEDILSQRCFKNSDKYQNEKIEIQCVDQNSFQTENKIYSLLYGTCNASLVKDMFHVTTNFSTIEDEISNEIFLLTSLNKASQNFDFVCFTPEMFLLSNNSSSSLMKQFCRGVSESFSAELQNQFEVSKFKNSNCEDSTDSVLIGNKDKPNPAISSVIFKTYQFYLFALCLIVSCTCTSSLFSMSDTACYESVRGVNYGRQRVWGSISWGLFAPLAGFLNDYTESYMASWCLMAFLYSLQIWNLSRMNIVKPDFTKSTLKDIKLVFSSVEFFAFSVGVFMNGFFSGVIWFYLTWFLTSIGGSKLVIGLAHTIECFVGEVPVISISAWMIKKFGHFNVVSLALLCQSIRLIGFSYLYNPWWVLPFESLHGFTYGSFYAAMTSYGKFKSKPGSEATTQAVLSTTYEGIGAGLGCMIAGICLDNYGAHTTFFFASLASGSAALVNVAATLLIKCRKTE